MIGQAIAQYPYYQPPQPLGPPPMPVMPQFGGLAPPPPVTQAQPQAQSTGQGQGTDYVMSLIKKMMGGGGGSAGIGAGGSDMAALFA